MTESAGPSPHDLRLEERLLDIQVHLFALRAAVQAVIIANPPATATLSAFDAIAARTLSQVALDSATFPHSADKPAQKALQARLADWRRFLAAPDGEWSGR